MAGRKFQYFPGKGVVEVFNTSRQELEKPIVSDACGFIQQQLGDFETDRVKNGFTGIEFVRDKDVPQFYQVKCNSRKEFARYVKHRGMCDRNSRNGSAAGITQKELDAAARLVKEKYPVKE